MFAHFKCSCKQFQDRCCFFLCFHDITSPLGFGLTEVHTGLWKAVLLGKAVKVPCGWSLVSLITPEPIPRHMCASGASLTSCYPAPLAHQTLGPCSMLSPASVFMGFNGLLRDFLSHYPIGLITQCSVYLRQKQSICEKGT